MQPYPKLPPKVQLVLADDHVALVKPGGVAIRLSWVSLLVILFKVLAFFFLLLSKDFRIRVHGRSVIGLDGKFTLDDSSPIEPSYTPLKVTGPCRAPLLLTHTHLK